MWQHQHHAPQASQGIDPSILSLTNDNRYHGNLSSPACPFASLDILNGPQNASATPIDQQYMHIDDLPYPCLPIDPKYLPAHLRHLAMNPGSPVLGDISEIAAVPLPIISSTQQLTPNISHAPLAAVGNGYGTGHNTPYTPQRQSAAVRTKPTAQQFRLNPYAARAPSIAATAGSAVPQFTSHATRPHPSSVLRRPNPQQIAYYASRAPPAAVPTRSNNQQLTSRTPHISAAPARTRPLSQQLGPYTAHNQAASLAFQYGAQQPNHSGGDDKVGYLTICTGSDQSGPYLSYTSYVAPVPPQTPSRTDIPSTGLLTPERTPTTNKPTSNNLPVASGSIRLPAAKNKKYQPAAKSKKYQPAAKNKKYQPAAKNKKYQPAAVNTLLRQDLPAQTRSPITSAEECSLKKSSDTPFEASLRAALEVEIKVLDNVSLEKERRKQLVMSEWADNFCKEGMAKADAVKEERDQFEIGKEDARKTIGSYVYHTYVDSTGFRYHDICLTRVDLTKNTNERILLSIFEADFSPPSYVTYVGIHGPGRAFKSEIVANGTNYKTAFLEFRKAFKKYTRVSWEARSMAPNYIADCVKTWEKQKLDQLMFERVGEQREGSRSRSISPVREGGEKIKSKSKKKAGPQHPEDVLTQEELESCRIQRYKYTPPDSSKPQGETPGLAGKYPVIPGDDPKDGGWTLIIP